MKSYLWHDFCAKAPLRRNALSLESGTLSPIRLQERCYVSRQLDCSEIENPDIRALRHVSSGKTSVARMILIIIAALAPERTPYHRNVNHRHGFRHAFSKRVCSHDAGSICVPPQKYIRYSYFEEGCRKRCTRQTRKVLWVVLS